MGGARYSRWKRGCGVRRAASREAGLQSGVRNSQRGTSGVLRRVSNVGYLDTRGMIADLPRTAVMPLAK